MPRSWRAARRVLVQWQGDLRDNGVVRRFFGLVGGLATASGAVQYVWPDSSRAVPAAAWPSLLVGIAAGTALIAVAWSWPHASVRYSNRQVGSWTVHLCRRDLFHGDAPVVVTVDRLATTDPALVGPDSLVGAMVRTWFGGDHRALEQALHEPAQPGTSHPLGHTVAFSADQYTGWLYCLANPAGTGPGWLELATGHERLWSTVRRSNVQQVAVPVIGAGFARAQLSFDGLLAMLLLSFHAASVQGTVTRTLHVCIRPEDFSTRLLTTAGRHLEALGYQRD